MNTAPLFTFLLFTISAPLILALGQAGDGTPFTWQATGVGGPFSYVATGNVTVRYLYPKFTVSPTTSIQWVIDPANQVINVLTPGYAGSQFVNAAGVQEYLPGFGCSYVPNYNYARYVASYAQLFQVFKVGAASDNSLLKTYAGLVRDPGTCQFYGEATIVTDWENKVVMYNLIQSLNLGPFGGPIKVQSFVEFYQWQRPSNLVTQPTQFLIPQAQFAALEPVPAALKCDGTVSYCDIFYPSSWNGTLNY